MTRPIPPLPKIIVHVSLEGGLNADESVKPFVQFAEFYLHRKDATTMEFPVPAAFTAYRVRTQYSQHDPTSAEMAFARLVINIVPDNIWDACVAAMEVGNDPADQVAYRIFRRWLSAASYAVDEG